LNDKRTLTRSIINTLFFIFGFTIIFVILGAGAGGLSQVLIKYRRLITIIGGIIIVLFSIQIMELFSIPFLNFVKRTTLKKKPKGIFGSLIIGVTFAAAWTPCIGPILSSILILAATKDTVIKGVVLLIAYSMGLGIPFLFSVIAFSYFISISNFSKKNYRTIKLMSGIILLAIGLILILGQFHSLLQALSFIPDYSLIKSDNISILICVLAGIISFISPCVLPIIPSYLTFITGVSVLELNKNK